MWGTGHRVRWHSITRPLNRHPISDNISVLFLAHICVACFLSSTRSNLPPSVQVSAPALRAEKDKNVEKDEEGNITESEVINVAKRKSDMRCDSISGGNGNGNGNCNRNAEITVSSDSIAKDSQRNRTRTRDRAQRQQISRFLHSCPSFCSYTVPPPVSVPAPAPMSPSPGNVTVPSQATRATSQHSSDAFVFQSSSSKSIDNPRSSADIASVITSFNSEFVVATAYNEGLQNMFGNVSALEVAVSLTRNAEIQSRTRKKKRNLGESKLYEEDRMDTELLSALPAFNFSNSCTRIIQSLEKSAKKEEEFLFSLRVKSVIDENGFSLSGWQTLLTLEGIREIPTEMPDV